MNIINLIYFIFVLRKRTGIMRFERGCWATTCGTVQLRISLKALPNRNPKPAHQLRMLAIDLNSTHSRFFCFIGALFSIHHPKFLSLKQSNRTKIIPRYNTENKILKIMNHNTRLGSVRL